MNRSIGPMAIFASLIATNDAIAQVTPGQVWDSFVASYASYGIAIDATTAVDGDTLRIGDVTGRITLPAGIGSMTFDLPDMVLTDNGDGTTSMVQPEEFSGNVQGQIRIDDNPLEFSLALSLSTRDATITASGNPGEVVFRAIVGRYDMTLDNLRATGLPDLDGVDLFMGLTIDDSDTTTRIETTDTLIRTEATSTAGRTVVDVNILSGPGTTTRSVTLIDKSESVIAISIPLAPIEMMNIAAALQDGLAVGMRATTFGQTAQTAVYLDDEIVSSQDQTVDDSYQEFSLSRDGLIVESTGNGIVIDFPMDDTLPIPVRFAADAARFALKLPVSASDVAQDFGLGFMMRDVTLSDDFWDMFDPERALPRDPATFDLAITGAATLAVDLFDFAALMDPAMTDRIAQGDLPVQVTALSMPALTLAVAGAALTGNASFAIDNSDLVTFAGLPKPVGTARFELNGANGLIDNLLALGLIAPDEAIGVRMGMALVGQVAGEDSMTSEIEINKAGHVIVNGQRMQ